MANFTQHGNKDYKFGFQDAGAAAIAAACGLKPQTLSITSEPEFQAQATNADGMTESVVVGPDKMSFTMNGYIVDEELLKAATNFTYDNKYFILAGRKVDTSNTDFTKGEMSGQSYPLITGEET